MVVCLTERSGGFFEKGIGVFIASIGSEWLGVCQIDIALGHFFRVVKGMGMEKINSESRDIF